VEAKPLLAAEAKKNQQAAGNSLGRAKSASLKNEKSTFKPLNVEKETASQFDGSQGYVYAAVDDVPFAFAGVWERWIAPDNKPVDSFAIITPTDPNELAATVHNRMPVILEPRDYKRWLTRADDEQPPVDLLRPYDAGRHEGVKGKPRRGQRAK
jgi:putative SOS response-associated peptidase YedK